jgi:hypothetical protein
MGSANVVDAAHQSGAGRNLPAGAVCQHTDHVILMPPGAGDVDLASGVRPLEHLAPAVLQVA